MNLKITALLFVFAALSILSIALGSADIPLSEILGDLSDVNRRIILNYRVPQCLTAIFAGASLSVAGLMLQTAFRNPLAGPSILGVSSGASLGVAVATMWVGSASSSWIAAASIAGALIGSLGILALILLFSMWLRSSVMLLVVGIMIGYFASSGISLLSFFAPSDTVKGFVVWGMGSFSNVQASQLDVFVPACALGLLLSVLLCKPMNAMLLGDNYAGGLGVDARGARNMVLAVSGLLTAIATAYCGPVSFIGLAVPHIARLIVGSSDHRMLLPASMLCGGIVALSCCIISASFPGVGVLPINALTPLFGAPVIVYVVLASRGSMS